VTNKGLVLHKLGTLRTHVERLVRRRPEALDLLQHDVDLQDAIGMSVLVAVQEAVDIAFHIATDEGFGLPASNAESFDLLAKHHVVSSELAAALVRAAGLRNRLAHGYASIDVVRLWNELPEGVRALSEFSKAVASWLG